MNSARKLTQFLLDILRISALPNKELIQFVRKNQEDNEELQRTLEVNGRSLCLVSADNFDAFIHTYNDRSTARATFDFEGKTFRNTTSTPGFPLTDLKWRSYVLQKQSVLRNWSSVFICIGLARKEPIKGIDKEYPMIISIMTDPEVPPLLTYPN
ncbi:hypothetical protein MUB24_20895 [Lederbergia sp. NSJ-179]|uniref:hypothetical protein n=1 Tax=Lederbergia sp. NSJ-179 TaxID=2931402 RepID=UPI001FD2DD58|nr:hypothetical protein [Lederbergia sp. NSJ-179]MCJ7843288.1 hypothetical protein [Lederbergia sp. NSJ-179]